ncbi:MAG: L,D-transpeptidase [Myxococcales bacterium]|nr:L,D-transpeptidase [Myxococcales bacterium]
MAVRLGGRQESTHRGRPRDPRHQGRRGQDARASRDRARARGGRRVRARRRRRVDRAHERAHRPQATAAHRRRCAPQVDRSRSRRAGDGRLRRRYAGVRDAVLLGQEQEGHATSAVPDPLQVVDHQDGGRGARDQPLRGLRGPVGHPLPRGLYFHAAYWHDQFGTPKSHGCVNLAPTDAKWVYDWTDPTMPAGWNELEVAAAGSVVVLIHDALQPDPPVFDYDKEAIERVKIRKQEKALKKKREEAEAAAAAAGTTSPPP